MSRDEVPNLYRKKPILIRAIKWTGDNFGDIDGFVGDCCSYIDGRLLIHTLEGDHTAAVGDYIIKGVKNEFYPCKPDIFWMTYESYEVVK